MNTRRTQREGLAVKPKKKRKIEEPKPTLARILSAQQIDPCAIPNDCLLLIYDYLTLTYIIRYVFAILGEFIS